MPPHTRMKARTHTPFLPCSQAQQIHTHNLSLALSFSLSPLQTQAYVTAKLEQKESRRVTLDVFLIRLILVCLIVHDNVLMHAHG